MFIPNIWKSKHVPKHQPVVVELECEHMGNSTKNNSLNGNIWEHPLKIEVWSWENHWTTWQDVHWHVWLPGGDSSFANVQTCADFDQKCRCLTSDGVVSLLISSLHPLWAAESACFSSAWTALQPQNYPWTTWPTEQNTAISWKIISRSSCSLW